jgi:hypothetical protein
MNPILEALKAGEKFPFTLLAAHFQDRQEHGEWWWSQARMGEWPVALENRAKHAISSQILRTSLVTLDAKPLL